MASLYHQLHLHSTINRLTPHSNSTSTFLLWINPFCVKLDEVTLLPKLSIVLRIRAKPPGRAFSAPHCPVSADLSHSLWRRLLSSPRTLQVLSCLWTFAYFLNFSFYLQSVPIFFSFISLPHCTWLLDSDETSLLEGLYWPFLVWSHSTCCPPLTPLITPRPCLGHSLQGTQSFSLLHYQHILSAQKMST